MDPNASGQQHEPPGYPWQPLSKPSNHLMMENAVRYGPLYWESPDCPSQQMMLGFAGMRCLPCWSPILSSQRRSAGSGSGLSHSPHYYKQARVRRNGSSVWPMQYRLQCTGVTDCVNGNVEYCQLYFTGLHPGDALWSKQR